MTTLIKAFDFQGTCVGCCNSSCYNAKHDKCTCICGGVNHAKGRAIAENNCHLVESLCQKEGLRIEVVPIQLRLWEDKCQNQT